MVLTIDSALQTGVYKVNITLTDDNPIPASVRYQVVIVISESINTEDLIVESSLEAYERAKGSQTNLVNDTPISSIHIDHLGKMTI